MSSSAPMPELVSRLVNIVLLRQGPQDLPAGASALSLAIALYALASGASLVLGEGPEHPAGILLLAIILPLVLTRIVLSLRGRPNRWMQTLTALFGTSALLSFISLPLSLAGGQQPPDALIVASLVLFIWSFAVDAHIWRHALDASFAVGLAVAVVLFATSLYVITSLAGPL